MKNKIAVLHGGWSHESNLCAFHAILGAIKRLGYQAQKFCCDDHEFIVKLIKFNPDVAFLASHGAYHEDGKLQGVLEYLDIPYIGSGTTASAIGMNKLTSKLFFKGMGFHTAPFILVEDGDVIPDYDHATHQLDTPLVIKPLNAGASVGLKIVTDRNEYERTLKQLLPVFRALLIEKHLGKECREFSVGVHEFFGRVEALPICELITSGGTYSYEMKNSLHGKLDRVIPAKIDNLLEKELKEFAIKIHRATGAETYSRVDMMVDKERKIFILEMNTLPGLLPMSIIPKAFKAIGISYDQLIDRLISSAKLPKRFDPKKLYSEKPELPHEVISVMLSANDS